MKTAQKPAAKVGKTQAQKNAEFIAEWPQQLGERSNSGTIAANFDVELHPMVWAQIANEAAHLGWTIPDVVRELCERYVDCLRHAMERDAAETVAYRQREAAQVAGRN